MDIYESDLDVFTVSLFRCFVVSINTCVFTVSINTCVFTVARSC